MEGVQPLPSEEVSWNPQDYVWDPQQLRVAKAQVGSGTSSGSAPTGETGTSSGAGVSPVGWKENEAKQFKPPKRPLICQVEECGKDLSTEKGYYQRYSVCPQHLKLLSLVVEGQLCRFCQQCGKFHNLSEFDGDRRSCRARLQKHNERRRKRDPAEDSGKEQGSGQQGHTRRSTVAAKDEPVNNNSERPEPVTIVVTKGLQIKVPEAAKPESMPGEDLSQPGTTVAREDPLSLAPQSPDQMPVAPTHANDRQGHEYSKGMALPTQQSLPMPDMHLYDPQGQGSNEHLVHQGHLVDTQQPLSSFMPQQQQQLLDARPIDEDMQASWLQQTKDFQPPGALQTQDTHTTNNPTAMELDWLASNRELATLPTAKRSAMPSRPLSRLAQQQQDLLAFHGALPPASQSLAEQIDTDASEPRLYGSLPMQSALRQGFATNIPMTGQYSGPDNRSPPTNELQSRMPQRGLIPESLASELPHTHTGNQHQANQRQSLAQASLASRSTLPVSTGPGTIPLFEPDANTLSLPARHDFASSTGRLASVGPMANAVAAVNPQLLAGSERNRLTTDTELQKQAEGLQNSLAHADEVLDYSGLEQNVSFQSLAAGPQTSTPGTVQHTTTQVRTNTGSSINSFDLECIDELLKNLPEVAEFESLQVQGTSNFPVVYEGLQRIAEADFAEPHASNHAALGSTIRANPSRVLPQRQLHESSRTEIHEQHLTLASRKQQQHLSAADYQEQDVLQPRTTHLRSQQPMQPHFNLSDTQLHLSQHGLLASRTARGVSSSYGGLSTQLHEYVPPVSNPALRRQPVRSQQHSFPSDTDVLLSAPLPQTDVQCSGSDFTHIDSLAGAPPLSISDGMRALVPPSLPVDVAYREGRQNMHSSALRSRTYSRAAVSDLLQRQPLRQQVDPSYQEQLLAEEQLLLDSLQFPVPAFHNNSQVTAGHFALVSGLGARDPAQSARTVNRLGTLNATGVPTSRLHASLLPTLPGPGSIRPPAPAPLHPASANLYDQTLPLIDEDLLDRSAALLPVRGTNFASLPAPAGASRPSSLLDDRGLAGVYLPGQTASAAMGLQGAQRLSSYDYATLLMSEGGMLAHYQHDELLLRISLKIANCTPDQLPPDLLLRVQELIHGRNAELLYGYLRPGCTHLLVDVLCPKDASSLDGQRVVDVLIPELTSQHTTLVQVNDAVSMSRLKPADSKTTPQLPAIALVTPAILTSNTHTNSDNNGILVFGTGLASSDVRLLARFQGGYLDVGVSPIALQTADEHSPDDSHAAHAKEDCYVTGNMLRTNLQQSDTASAASAVVQCLRSCGVRVDSVLQVTLSGLPSATASGLCFLEAELASVPGVLSHQHPVVLTSSHSVVEELEDLFVDVCVGWLPQQAYEDVVKDLGLFLDRIQGPASAHATFTRPSSSDSTEADADPAPVNQESSCSSPVSETSAGSAAAGHVADAAWPAVRQLPAQHVMQLGGQLLKYACMSGQPAIATSVLESLLDAGLDGYDIQELTCSEQNGLTLLHACMISGKPGMVAVMNEWIDKFALDWEWDVKAMGGLTPLHLAARHSPEIGKVLMQLVPGGRMLWMMVEADDGMTPADVSVPHQRATSSAPASAATSRLTSTDCTTTHSRSTTASSRCSRTDRGAPTIRQWSGFTSISGQGGVSRPMSEVCEPSNSRPKSSNPVTTTMSGDVVAASIDAATAAPPQQPVADATHAAVTSTSQAASIMAAIASTAESVAAMSVAGQPPAPGGRRAPSITELLPDSSSDTPNRPT